MAFNEDTAVTLEISALQYFPWLIAQAKQAIAQQQLMPGRFIRVRRIRGIFWRLPLLCTGVGAGLCGNS